MVAVRKEGAYGIIRFAILAKIGRSIVYVLNHARQILAHLIQTVG